jgi:hypothetical protein
VALPVAAHIYTIRHSDADYYECAFSVLHVAIR